MSAISQLCANLDRAADYVPVVSTAIGLIDIFQKCAVIPCMSRNFVATSHYYHHLDQKSVERCLWVLVPVAGNVYACIDDIGPVAGGNSSNVSRENPDSLGFGGGCADVAPFDGCPPPGYNRYSYGYGGGGSSDGGIGQCPAPSSNPFHAYTQCSAHGDDKRD